MSQGVGIERLGAMTAGPVFIAGLERSGTSLIYALLGSHPDIAMSRRTNLWRYVYNQYGDLSDAARLDHCLETLAKYKRLRVLDLDFEALRASFVSGPATYERLFELIWRQVADSQGKTRWGDKSLLTERFAALIFAAYPGARILHMVRDPRDRFASARTRWGRGLGGVGAGTAEWVRSIGEAAANQAAFPDSYRLVRYEDLVTDPVGVLGDICDLIEAPYTEAMFAMGGAASFREGGGNSSYGRRAAGTISRASVGKYREVLTPRQIEFIELLAGDLMRRLGYETETAPGALGTLAHPIEIARYHAWSWWEAAKERRPGRGIPEYRIVEAT